MNRDTTGAGPALARFQRGFTRHLGERDFWLIQAVVFLISVVHIALEAGAIPLGSQATLPAAHHIPVILYLAPVAYAGLIYGREGGVLTGLWAGVLASVNLVLFSLEDWEWILELVFVLAVIGMGVVMSLPVERERQQRRRAERAAHHLETLNELANVAVPARTPAQAADTVLAEFVRQMDFADAGISLWRRGESAPVVKASHKQDSEIARYIADQSQPMNKSSTSNQEVGSRLIEVPIATERLSGSLIVESNEDGLNDQASKDFLATAGNQLAVRVENALLLEQEQNMMATYVKLITEAQEEERKRLARDLHDGPAQHLAILVRSLEGERNDGHDSSGDLHRSASAILTELRSLARDQRPTLLDDLGIVAALEWLIGESAKRSDSEIRLTVDGVARRLNPATEVALYRIAQEALRNAERHSDASEIKISMHFAPHLVSLRIADDGEGFVVPSSPGYHLRSGRLGLMGMYERAQLVGGTLDIQSSKETGTIINAKVDIDGPDQ